MVLAHDRPPLTGYDQDLWASRLRYRDVEVRDAFEQFSAIRRGNVRIWERLNPTDLVRVGIHGERGEESLEHLRRCMPLTTSYTSSNWNGSAPRD